ncbi:RNA-binding KH domain-containing protein PEPPER [Vitis vinifera]|uniref:RNA-binding KH domain-containing protein PEPPER n=1 Tax=Vitis vinifera TaxID=29760 RepID=A0A438JFB8_VITVI|nr:RNA-binding KH domain-containing protein PEPPER [Vitis vinifera]
MCQMGLSCLGSQMDRKGNFLIDECGHLCFNLVDCPNEVPFYAAADERIVELQGEALKVQKALEAVVGHLRKFLVDHSVLPLFERTYNATISQDRQSDTWADKSLLHGTSQTGMGSDYSLPAKRESLYLDRETQMEHSGLPMYGQEHGLSGIRSSGLGRAGAPIVTQIAQTMQIPLSYAEDIIGIGGANIAYIRRTSGAILTVQESRGLPDEITVEIKGTSSQISACFAIHECALCIFHVSHTDLRLGTYIQSWHNLEDFVEYSHMLCLVPYEEFISNHKEPVPSSYGKMDSGLRSSYSQLGNTSYSSSSLSSQPYGGGYGSSGVGGYSSYRL